MANNVTAQFLADTLHIKSARWLLYSGDIGTSTMLLKHNLRKKEEIFTLHISSVLIRSVALVYLQVNRSYWQNLLLLSSFSVPRSVTLISQGHKKTLRITSIIFSIFFW